MTLLKSAEQSPAIKSALSRNERFGSSINGLLDKMSGGSACFPRFLPLLYLAVCLPTVVFLIFFRQPLGTPDETSHVARAYQISKGVFLTEEAVPGLHPKGKVDEGWLGLGSQVNKRRFENLNTALPSFQEFGWAGRERLRRFNSSVYFPAAFIPQAVGLKIAQAWDLRLVQSLQLASVLNAVVCLLAIALAIHLTPAGKYFVSLIGALPMSLHQFASVSPDGVLIAGSMLMFSLTMRALTRPEVRFSALLGLIALGSIAAATKLPYLMVALSALAVLWCTEPRSRRTSAKYIVGCVAMVGVPALWTKISNAGAVRHSLLIQTDPDDQIAFLLSHPLEIPALAYSTLHTQLDSYLAQIIGVLGWLDAPLPPLAYVVLGVGLVAMLVMDGAAIQPLLRWIVLTGCIASAALIFLSLYLIWNPLGAKGPIEGVQGRYFLPILPFLVFLIPKLKRFDADNIKLSLFVLCGLVSGLATVATIFKRYYS